MICIILVKEVCTLLTELSDKLFSADLVVMVYI